VNRIKRHTKVVNQGGRAGTTGGIVTQEAAIHVSNVMLLVDAPKGSDDKAPQKGKVTTRVGFKRTEVTKRRSDGSTYTAERSTRVARKSGEEI
jgi:large subunit ribosomal protein L24